MSDLGIVGSLKAGRMHNDFFLIENLAKQGLGRQYRVEGDGFKNLTEPLMHTLNSLSFPSLGTGEK